MPDGYSTITEQRKLLESYRNDNTVLKDQLEMCKNRVVQAEEQRAEFSQRHGHLLTMLTNTKVSRARQTTYALSMIRCTPRG